MITAIPEPIRELWRRGEARQEDRPRIMVCTGTGCVANGSQLVYEELRRLAEGGGDVSIQRLEHDCRCSASGLIAVLCDPVSAVNGRANSLLSPAVYGRDFSTLRREEPASVARTGCQGLCARGPLVQVEPVGVTYTDVKPSDAEDVYDAALRGETVDRLLYRSPDTGEPYGSRDESPFYRGQRRLVLSNCGRIDPERIQEYLEAGGYRALAKALGEMTPEQLCADITASGLRGRGGAGFPAGKKWELVRTNRSMTKYVVCNGDEGDPGAFMNGSLMEGDPHRVLEGLIIAGYAQGASNGIFYVRAEYPLAVRRLKLAIAQAEEFGLLGDDIMGSGFDFHVKFKEGAGAFVCGEETALMASVEGSRGMPRPKPPYPAASGLWGCPTTINNVETLSHVPEIVLKGPDWFRSIGTPNSPGTKTFALTGKITNTGLVEIPMGCTLREMIFEIGGGIPDGKRLKAVQIGGPSGGCLTEQHLELGLDFDSLQSAGAMVGSGGLVVMDEDNCIVEVARFFMQFIQSESCGKCVACREGTKQMLALLQKIVDGQGTVEDLELLEDVALVVKDASLCGLGKTAANPVLSTVRYFRDEYLAHVQDGRCPAGACQAYRKYRVVAEKCVGCGRCVWACPAGAISGERKEPHLIDQASCISCGACMEACRLGAIEEG